MAKKKLFKTCPSCKFAKCWVAAKACENCGFDFVLGRKPRKGKPEELDDDVDDEPVVVVTPAPPPPSSTKKKCPGCAHECWWKAPFCEVCEWNFKTNSPKEQPKPIRPVVRETEMAPVYFGGRAVAHVWAPGGYGKAVQEQNKQILKIRPPLADKATYNNVACWISRLQQFTLSKGTELAEGAIVNLLRNHVWHGRKDLAGDGFKRIAEFITDIYVNLKSGVPMNFTEDEEDLPPEPEVQEVSPEEE